MRASFAVLLLCLAFAACQPGPEDEQPQAPQGGGGGGASSQGGGGGDVALGGSGSAPASNPEHEARYEKALKKIKEKDFDSAYLELGALLSAAPDANLAAKAAKEIEKVQAQLLQLPPTPPKQVLSTPKKFGDKAMSVRGAYRAPASGGAKESFWIDAEGGAVECRYQRLHPEAKRALATLPAGTKLLVRGFWKAAGPSPYLDVSLFKIES